MNVIRRSHCVLNKLFSGSFSRIRPVYYREQIRSLRTGFTLKNTNILSVTDFNELQSQNNTNIRGDTDGDRGPESQHGEFDLDVMVSLLRQENADDICVIKVPEELKYTQFFITVSGSSTRHLKAMALYAIKVYKFMKKDSDPPVHLEGKDAEDWMCIDFGSMVVHFMLPETRATYELEKLWTLRSYDEQLSKIPDQNLPADFIYDAETV